MRKGALQGCGFFVGLKGKRNTKGNGGVGVSTGQHEPKDDDNNDDQAEPQWP
jgi:hypothetical protein